MSYSSKVLYEGDSVTKDFTVTMPYLSQSHIFVYVDEILQLNPMHYTWSGPSTIRFADAPGLDSAIRIQRWTSPINTLVDFTDGSTLRADDLDTAYLHNFYLQQEYVDSFNEVINNALVAVATDAGLIEVSTDTVVEQLVAEMLNNSAAATIQARIADIDTNAEAIITLGESLQVQINTIAEAAAATVFVQADEPVPGVGGVPDPIPEGARWYDTDDNNAPYIYQSGAWVAITDPRIGQALADISLLNVQLGQSNAAIIDERFVRAQEDEALGQRLGLLGTETGDQQAFILDLDTVQVSASTGETLSQRFTTLSAADSQNASDILTEQTARISGDSANASDITALDSRMTTAEGNISGQSSAISALQTDVSTVQGDVATNVANISANSTSITSLNSTIDLRARTFMQDNPPTADNAGDIWIDTNDNNKMYRWNGASWVDATNDLIGANAAAVSQLQTDVSNNANSIGTNTGNITANANAITSLDTRLTTAEGTVAGHSTSISSLQSQVTANDGDISANAADITSLQSTVNLRATTFAQSLPPTANNTGDLWIDTDTNILHRWNGSTWVELQDTAVAGNASAISTLQTDVSTNAGNISSNASSITSLQASVTTNTGDIAAAEVNITANASAISDAETDITTLYAKYGVTLNVDGYITGFAQNNDGSTGTFVVLADKFAVVTPSTTWQASTAYSLGDTIRPTTSNGRVYECTSAGTSGGSEPTWTTTIGNTQGDGTVTWTCRDDATLQPFLISGNNIQLNGNVEVNGNLLLNGTVVGSALVAGTIGSTQIGSNAITTTHISSNTITTGMIQANAITADKINVTNLNAVKANTGALTVDGTLTVGTSGKMISSGTGFQSGTGFFLGYDSSAYKFYVGDYAGANYLSWDGSELKVRGNLSLGSYSWNTVDSILEALTERSHNALTWSEKKKFKINKPGTLRVYWQTKLGSTTGGVVTLGQVRVLLDGVVKDTNTVGTSSYITQTYVITTTENSDYITLEIRGGERNTSEPVNTATYIKDVKLQGVIDLGEQVITD